MKTGLAAAVVFIISLAVAYSSHGAGRPSEERAAPPARPTVAEGLPAATPARVVHFPKDRSLGALRVVAPEKLAQFSEWMVRGPWYSGPGWERLGEARGDVAVPGGMLLHLYTDDVAVQDLSGLSALRPDDLYMLTLRGEVGDAGMRYVASLKGLRALSLAGMTGNADAALARLKELPNLEYLELPVVMTAAGSVHMTDVGLAHVSEIRSLKGLHRLGGGVTNAGLAQLAKLQNLEDLWITVYEAVGIGDAGLAHLAKLPRLRSLQIGGTFATFSNLGLVHLKNVPSLRKLNLTRFPINELGLKYLSELQNLEQLDLYGTPVSFSGLAYLKKMRSLKALNLRKPAGSPVKVTDDWLFRLKDMKSLEHLDIGNSKLTDRGMTYLSEMENLRIVSVLSGPITDAGIANLAKLHNLEDVFINTTSSRFPTFTDKGIAALATLSNLRKLRLRGAEISDTGLGELAKLKFLEELDLSGAKHLSVRGLAQLKSLHSLRSLRVNFSARALNDGPLDLSGLGALEFLGLSFLDRSGKSAFTDEDLASLANLRRLNCLWLHPPRFSDAGTAQLAGLTKLETLCIGGPELTNAGLACLDDMKGMYQLMITDGRFTDDGLRHIALLRSVDILTLPTGKGFSPAAVERLRSQLPRIVQREREIRADMERQRTQGK